MLRSISRYFPFHRPWPWPIRCAAARLLVPQRDHGINPRRSECGHGTRGKCDDAERSGDDNVGQRIAERDAEDESREGAAERERAGNPGADADKPECHPFANYQAYHPMALRPKAMRRPISRVR
jgi:hypothetical protein